MARMETWVGGRAPARARRGTSARQVVQRYYASEAVPCPVGCGGVAEVVRVSARAGGGELWTECTSCAQRGRYDVARATSRERAAVAAAIEDGRPASCGRHAAFVLLERRGRRWLCPVCGVVYRE